MCVCIQVPLFYQDTDQSGLGPTPWPHFNLTIPVKTCWRTIVVWDEHAGYNLLNKEAQASHMGWQVAAQHPSSRFGEVKTPGQFWLKVWFQYIYTKDIKSQGLLQIPEMDAVIRGNSSPLPPVRSEQEVGIRVAGTYYTYKVVGSPCLFSDSTLGGYFKRCLWKSRVGTCGGNPRLGSLSKSPDSGCEQGVTLKNAWAATPNSSFSYHKTLSLNKVIFWGTGG